VSVQRVFEWDEQKAELNRRKHAVPFHVAATVFKDPLAITAPDRIENGEQRWQTIGMADEGLLLMVAHTVRFETDEEDLEIEVIRIISARRVEPKERKHYEHG
jgi:uncharacterized DUF497 family protein